MARAIIRFSIQAGQVQLRNKVRNALEDAVFTKIGTSCCEAPDLPLTEVLTALNVMTTKLATAKLDHLWIYVDQLDSTDPLPTVDSSWSKS